MAGPFRCVRPSKLLDYSMVALVICVVGGLIIDPIIFIIIERGMRFWGRLGVGILERLGAGKMVFLLSLAVEVGGGPGGLDSNDRSAAALAVMVSCRMGGPLVTVALLASAGVPLKLCLRVR